MPSEPLHRAAGFPQSEQATEQETGSSTEGSLFVPDHRSDTPSPLPYSVRSKSLDPAHTKGRGLPKGLNARSWRSLGTNLEAAYLSATGLGTTEAFGSECIRFLRQVNIISFST